MTGEEMKETKLSFPGTAHEDVVAYGKPQKELQAFETLSLQFSQEELIREVLASEGSGAGIPNEEVWNGLRKKFSWLCV